MRIVWVVSSALSLAGCAGAQPAPATVEVPLAAPSAEPPEASADVPRQTTPAGRRAPPLRASAVNLDAAAAEALFREGRQLMDSGAIAQACVKFEESLRLDPALGTMLNLAVCEERAGNTKRACQI